MVRVEEEDSSDETWGKRSARSRGVSTHKESKNGSSTRWLAGDECGGGLPRGGGKMLMDEETSATRAFYRRQGWSGWWRACPSACRRQAGPAGPRRVARVPCLGRCCVPRSGLKPTRHCSTGPHCSLGLVH
jgi:hypothetical protein